LTFIPFTILTVIDTNLDPDRAPSSESTCGERMRWGVGKFLTVISSSLVLMFCFVVEDIQTKTLVLATGASDLEYQFLSVLVPIVLGNLVLMFMRIQTRGGGKIPLTAALMLSFLGSSFASLAARRFVLEEVEV